MVDRINWRSERRKDTFLIVLDTGKDSCKISKPDLRNAEELKQIDTN